MNVQMKQLIWFGQVKKIDDKRLPKSVMDFNSSQKRKKEEDLEKHGGYKQGISRVWNRTEIGNYGQK